MDNEGWVPMSRIAEFKRVKRMNVEIPFILDALQASETIEVQGEKVRRRVEWSKWISKSVNNESTSIDGNFVDKDNGKQNTKDSPDGTTEIRPTNKSLGDLSLAADAVENSLKSSTDHNKNSKEQK